MKFLRPITHMTTWFENKPIEVVVEQKSIIEDIPDNKGINIDKSRYQSIVQASYKLTDYVQQKSSLYSVGSEQ